MSRKWSYRWILVAVLGVMLTSTALADTIVTGPVDQAGFQALIDAASPGDTISCLGGTYDFSDPGPVFLSKKLAILAEDKDDPPIFVGDGTFFTDLITGNNGFVQAPGSFIEALKLEGLHFEDFDRTMAFTNSHDFDSPGCPLIPGAGARNVEILDNTVRNSRRFFQVFGGPFDDYVIKGNDSETSQGIIIIGTVVACPFDGSLLELVRPTKGVIEKNDIRAAGNLGVIAGGSEETSIKENHVESGAFGIFVFDDKAFFLPDDGPIFLGSIEQNVIEAGFAGIVAEGPTTISDTAIKDNEISGALFGIFLDLGANGFVIESNEISGSALDDIFLDSDTFNNLVKAFAGDVVTDLGDNEVEIKD